MFFLSLGSNVMMNYEMWKAATAKRAQTTCQALFGPYVIFFLFVFFFPLIYYNVFYLFWVHSNSTTTSMPPPSLETRVGGAIFHHPCPYVTQNVRRRGQFLFSHIHHPTPAPPSLETRVGSHFLSLSPTTSPLPPPLLQTQVGGAVSFIPAPHHTQQLRKQPKQRITIVWAVSSFFLYLFFIHFLLLLIWF
jgi:hypothetical protein